MKKTICAALAALLIAASVSASAGAPGSAGDYLVSKSYVEGTYTQAVLDQGLRAIDERLSAQGGQTVPSTVTGGREALLLPYGTAVTLYEGATVVVTGGTVRLDIAAGEVVDSVAGAAAATGGNISNNRRYICAEGATAVITASSAAAVTVEGPHETGSGAQRQFADYSDICGTEWYSSAAAFAKSRRLFPDWDGARFRPNEPATRAEIVYAIWVTVGRPAPAGAASFTDLTESWYADAVAWSQGNQIVNGFTDNTFRPNESLAREQMAAIMFRYVRNSGGDVSAGSDITGFRDYAQIGDWARESVSWAVGSGILRGSDTQMMLPNNSTTRAELATVLMRFAGN